MKNVRLLRLSEHNGATKGILFIDGEPLFLTLELPWRDNQKNISCIPLGEYDLRLTHSPRFGETYEIEPVPNRDAILIHAGNTANDTQGCVLVGYSYGEINKLPAVRESQRALSKFLDLMDSDVKGKIWVESAI